MDRSRALLAVSVSVILGVTLLSGPAIGVVDLTQPRIDTAGLGQGNATVDAVEAPESVRLDRAIQSESYYVEVPNARLHVTAVTGRPSVSYKLSIRELGYTRGSTHFLTPGDTGWIAVSIEREALPGDRITESSYDGTLTVILRYNDTERVLTERPVTVEVTG